MLGEDLKIVEMLNKPGIISRFQRGVKGR